MQCSWKAVILLGLASIAIQYTAIRTFTSERFQICPASSSANCSQAQEPETFDRFCEDFPYFRANASRAKVHVLILATTRSGSSFAGQLFNQHPDVFYLFEPLYHVQQALIPTSNRYATDRRVMLGASRDLLRSLYHCDLHFLESYIKPLPANHTTDKIFRRGVSRALCSPPACNAFTLNEMNIDEGECVKKCTLLNLTLAAESCRDRRHVAIKTVRIPEVGDLRALVEDPRLNLKVIHLVRDPRGILASRMDTFRDIYRLWRIWRATGRKPYNLDSNPIATMCDDILRSVNTVSERPAWLRGRYMLVRYEDLARRPLQKTRQIYDFLGMSINKGVEEWIQNNTRGSREGTASHKFSTLRDSAANAESWRLKLTHDIVEYTQTMCQQVSEELGYRAVKSPAELKNLSLSLIEDRTFAPFW